MLVFGGEGMGGILGGGFTERQLTASAYLYIRRRAETFWPNLHPGDFVTYSNIWFLGAFANFRKATISFVMSVRPPRGITRLPLDGFSWNLVFEYFWKSVEKIQGAFLQPRLMWKRNKYYIFWVCVCSLMYPAYNARAPYYHLWPAPLYNIFPRYLINDAILEEK